MVSKSKSNASKLLLAGVAGAGLLVAGGSQAVAHADSVKVQKNDTVWALSQKYGVSIKSIESLNNINQNSHLIFVGQEINIPEKNNAEPKTSVSDKVKADSVTVKSGDSLSVIAQRYGVSVNALMQANHLTSSLILVGQQLNIPSGNTVSTHSTYVAPAAPASSAAKPQVQTAALLEATQSAASNSAAVSSAVQSSSAASQTPSSAVTSSAASSVAPSSVAPSSVATASSTQANSAASHSYSKPASAASSASVATNANQAASSAAPQISKQQQAASSAAPSSAPAATNHVASSVAPSSAPAATNHVASSAAPSSAPATTNYVASSAAPSSAPAASTNHVASSAAPSSAATSNVQNTGSVTGLATSLANNTIPYVWGGKTPAGFDCSGFVSYVFQHAAGISLPSYTVAMESYVNKESVSAAQPGDLLFWGTPGATYHVGIYLGNNQYASAPTFGQNVKVQTISSYFYPSFAGRVK